MADEYNEGVKRRQAMDDKIEELRRLKKFLDSKSCPTAIQDFCEELLKDYCSKLGSLNVAEQIVKNI